jgi:hypothetical protein
LSRSLQVLTPVEAKIVGALGQTMYPREGAIPIDANQARAIEYVDAWLAALPLRERTLVRLMFVLFEISMPVFGPSRLRTFTRADPESQYEYLAAWETSRLYFRRAAMFGMRSVFALAYMADPEVQRHIGVEDGVEILRRQRAARVADRSGADIDPAANVAVFAEAVDAVRDLDREQRGRAGPDGKAAAVGGDS